MFTGSQRHFGQRSRFPIHDVLLRDEPGNHAISIHILNMITCYHLYTYVYVCIYTYMIKWKVYYKYI